VIRITSKLAMSVFDSYKRNGNLTTHQPLQGSSTIIKFWTNSLVFAYDTAGAYTVDTKNKAKSRSALPLFEAWVHTNHPKEIA
jgi:hypothetical protein